jgi:hypothetical protein
LLTRAVQIFEGEHDDVSVSGYHYFDHDQEYEFLHRSVTFYTSKSFIKHGLGLAGIIQ